MEHAIRPLRGQALRIKLGNKLWTLTFTSLRDRDGDCDPPETPNKQIRIHNRLSDKRELEILIHEMLHACDWWKDEEWIATVAHQMAHVLYKLGYRKER